jgi:ankyrin repeat protein
LSKTNFTILVLCLVIIASVILIYNTSKQFRLRYAEGTASMGPMFDAIHTQDYNEVEKLAKEDPGVLGRPHAMGGTYMNCAASNRDTKMVKLLIKLGANPNGLAGCGMAPIILACGANDLLTAEVLLKAGANPNIYGHDINPLESARSSNHTEMVKLLQKYGAKIITQPTKSPLKQKATP